MISMATLLNTSSARADISIASYDSTIAETMTPQQFFRDLPPISRSTATSLQSMVMHIIKRQAIEGWLGEIQVKETPQHGGKP
jgi:hypothetical protein